MKNTEIALNRAKSQVKEIKKDLSKNYKDVVQRRLQYLEQDLLSIREQIAYDCKSSYDQGKEDARAKARENDNERFEATMAAFDPIGTQMRTLRDVYAPKEGSNYHA